MVSGASIYEALDISSNVSSKYNIMSRNGRLCIHRTAHDIHFHSSSGHCNEGLNVSSNSTRTSTH